MTELHSALTTTRGVDGNVAGAEQRQITNLMIMLSREPSSYQAQSKATVADGAFRAGPFSQKGGDLNPGEYTITVGTPLAALQPASVQAVIGRDGGKLRGPLARSSGFGGMVVEYSTKQQVGGPADPRLDALAREAARQDLLEWMARN